jgi:hypothetical protein
MALILDSQGNGSVMDPKGRNLMTILSSVKEDNKSTPNNRDTAKIFDPSSSSIIREIRRNDIEAYLLSNG